MSRCPGQDMRNLSVAMYRCPACGYEVELFSDEHRRRCPNCKTMVEKDAAPSCALWCQAARECLGEDRYRRLKEAQSQESDDTPHD